MTWRTLPTTPVALAATAEVLAAAALAGAAAVFAGAAFAAAAGALAAFAGAAALGAAVLGVAAFAIVFTLFRPLFLTRSGSGPMAREPRLERFSARNDFDQFLGDLRLP